MRYEREGRTRTKFINKDNKPWLLLPQRPSQGTHCQCSLKTLLRGKGRQIRLLSSELSLFNVCITFSFSQAAMTLECCDFCKPVTCAVCMFMFFNGVLKSRSQKLSIYTYTHTHTHTHTHTQISDDELPTSRNLVSFSDLLPRRTGARERWIGISRLVRDQQMQTYIGWINNNVLLYTTGNYIPYPVTNDNIKEYEQECVYMYNCITLLQSQN